MKALGLRAEIKSPEDFKREFEKGYSKALDSRQASLAFTPTAEILRDVHKEIFGNILQEPGRFRGEESPKKVHEMISNIDKAAEKGAQLMDKASQMGQVKVMADYATAVMKEKPFRDTENSYVNRAVTACVLEAQLEHCFGKDIKREADAKEFDSAVERGSPEKALPRAMRELVREMSGGKANVIDMQKFRQEKATQKPQEHDRDRDR